MYGIAYGWTQGHSIYHGSMASSGKNRRFLIDAEHRATRTPLRHFTMAPASNFERENSNTVMGHVFTARCICIARYTLFARHTRVSIRMSTYYQATNMGCRPSGTTVFGRPFVKWFALCYRSVVLSVCLSVLSVYL